MNSRSLPNVVIGTVVTYVGDFTGLELITTSVLLMRKQKQRVKQSMRGRSENRWETGSETGKFPYRVILPRDVHSAKVQTVRFLRFLSV